MMIHWTSVDHAAHLDHDALEAYSTGRSTDLDSERIEEHLKMCERCQEELATGDQYIRSMKSASRAMAEGARLVSIHITEDGPIFGVVHMTPDLTWQARHWGRQLDGGRLCKSRLDACGYLIESFYQMFPGHVCERGCRQFSRSVTTARYCDAGLTTDLQ